MTSNNGQAGGPGRVPTLRHWAGHTSVQIYLGRQHPPEVRLSLSNKAARQLLIALGMNGRRFGPEVQAVTEGLSMLLIGVIAGEETAHYPKEEQ